MINLTLKTEYSFRKCFAHLKDIVNEGDYAVGIADINSTFGHVKLRTICKEKGVKPVFGVRLTFTDTVVKSRAPMQTFNKRVDCILIARNSPGLIELYKLVGVAFEQFYYFPRLLNSQAPMISKNIFLIVPDWKTLDQELIDRADLRSISIKGKFS